MSKLFDEVFGANNHGWTPLHLGQTSWLAAANQNSIYAVAFLPASQADVNVTNNQGHTALHLADENNFPDVADLLRLHGGHD